MITLKIFIIVMIIFIIIVIILTTIIMIMIILIIIIIVGQIGAGRLPPADQLPWLVSEEDAPQQLLPLPDSLPVDPEDDLKVRILGHNDPKC